MMRQLIHICGWLLLSFGTGLASASGVAPTPSAIAPPMAQESADCIRPVYATDRLVCDDAELRRLDADMAVRAMRLRQGTGWPVSPLFEDQHAWFKRRSRCAFQTDHRGCAAAAYRARIAELDAILDPPARRDPLRCVAGGPSRISPATEDGARVLFDVADTAMSVALPANTGPWVPFLVYRVSGRRMILHRLDDPKRMTCRVRSHGG